VLGCVTYPVGKIGELFATMVKLAVNRQREFLADATAVEITRNPAGLVSALQAIADHSAQIESPAAVVASHLFFADIRCSWLVLLETHPPLNQRMSHLLDHHRACPDGSVMG